MTPDLLARSRARAHGTRQMWWIVLVALFLFGIIGVDSFEIRLGYLLVCITAMLPAWLWLKAGGGGVPILPVVALMYLLYYATPMATANYDVNLYSPDDLLRAGIAVAIYLGSATITWWAIRQPTKRSIHRMRDENLLTDRQTVRICLAGLGLGAVFEVVVVQGWMDWAGSTYGAMRAVAYSTSILSCYLLGVLLGQEKLRADQRGLAITFLVTTVLLSVSSLFLVRGLMLIGTLAFAYFITTRRWLVVMLMVLLPLVYVLHAGKAEMREQYWHGDSRVTSVLEVPALYAEWVDRGLNVLAEGREGQNVIERTSLLQMLLRAQAQTPRNIDFLYGATYAMLPAMLVPRFLWPDKPVSQAAMNMLNLRYGLVYLDQLGQIDTAIGWGVIAEGYVNFGLPGVIGVGLVMGVFMGLMDRWAIGQPALALPTLLAIITMVTLLRLETDLTYLATILWQSYIAVTLLFIALRARTRRRTRLATANHRRGFDQ